MTFEPLYTIDTSSGQKGRSFSATCLGYILADNLWPGGMAVTPCDRPVWAQFVSSRSELRAFVANLLGGYKAHANHNRPLEFMKSIRYAVSWQHMDAGSVVTISYQDLFIIDPGMVDPDTIDFVCMPNLYWVEKQKKICASICEESALFQRVVYNKTKDYKFWFDLAPVAMLWLAQLDRRTKAPIIQDPKFALFLLMGAFDKGFAVVYPSREPEDFYEWGDRRNIQVNGIENDYGVIIVTRCKHDIFEAFLSEKVKEYVSLVGVDSNKTFEVV